MIFQTNTTKSLGVAAAAAAAFATTLSASAASKRVIDDFQTDFFLSVTQTSNTQQFSYNANEGPATSTLTLTAGSGGSALNGAIQFDTEGVLINANAQSQIVIDFDYDFIPPADFVDGGVSGSFQNIGYAFYMDFGFWDGIANITATFQPGNNSASEVNVILPHLGGLVQFDFNDFPVMPTAVSDLTFTIEFVEDATDVRLREIGVLQNQVLIPAPTAAMGGVIGLGLLARRRR